MMDPEVIKTEVLSPPPSTSSFPSSPDGPISTKKLDPIDKWRTRVLFCGRTTNSGDGEESWSKRIEKQVAVLRVAFPFLTERQIQGKAWQSCGLNSFMGGVPRCLFRGMILIGCYLCLRVAVLSVRERAVFGKLLFLLKLYFSILTYTFSLLLDSLCKFSK